MKTGLMTHREGFCTGTAKSVLWYDIYLEWIAVYLHSLQFAPLRVSTDRGTDDGPFLSGILGFSSYSCDSASWCCGLVCSVWSWYFLVIFASQWVFFGAGIRDLSHKNNPWIIFAMPEPIEMLPNSDFVCLIWFFTSHQQPFSLTWLGLPGLNQY